MNRANSSARHRILLLSVWCEDHGEGAGNTEAGGPVVRFSLEDPRTGMRRGFQDQDALVAGLDRLLNADECAEASCSERTVANSSGKDGLVNLATRLPTR